MFSLRAAAATLSVLALTIGAHAKGAAHHATHHSSTHHSSPHHSTAHRSPAAHHAQMRRPPARPAYHRPPARVYRKTIVKTVNNNTNRNTTRNTNNYSTRVYSRRYSSGSGYYHRRHNHNVGMYRWRSNRYRRHHRSNSNIVQGIIQNTSGMANSGSVQVKLLPNSTRRFRYRNNGVGVNNNVVAGVNNNNAVGVNNNAVGANNGVGVNNNGAQKKPTIRNYTVNNQTRYEIVTNNLGGVKNGSFNSLKQGEMVLLLTNNTSSNLAKMIEVFPKRNR